MALAITCQAPAAQTLRQYRTTSVSRPSVLAGRPAKFLLRAKQVQEGANPVTKEEVEQPTSSTRNVRDIEPGNISNEAAEARADIGKERKPSLTEAQAFDGPAPETVNSRLAMLGVTSALGAEFATGVGIKQQVAQEPVGILAAFIIISLASYIPIARGFTRKEPFSNTIFNPQAENWNGRLAMVGFAGILVTEALSGKTIPAFYGLPHGGL